MHFHVRAFRTTPSSFESYSHEMLHNAIEKTSPRRNTAACYGPLVGASPAGATPQRRRRLSAAMYSRIPRRASSPSALHRTQSQRSFRASGRLKMLLAPVLHFNEGLATDVSAIKCGAVG